MNLLKSLLIVLFITFLSIGCGSSGGGGGENPHSSPTQTDNDNNSNNDASTGDNQIKSTTTVSGTVLDANSNPIEGAEVTIKSDPVTVKTDANGFFSATVETGTHTIEIKKGSIVIHSEQINCEQNIPLLLGNIKTDFDAGSGNFLSFNKISVFTENINNSPHGLEDGWYLHLRAEVDDLSGIPGNIQTVEAVNLDSNTDPNIYVLDFSTDGVDSYYKHPDYVDQRGTYHFTAISKQGHIIEKNSAPLDNPVKLNTIQYIMVSDNSTTPTVTFNTVDNADTYSISIFNESLDERIYQSKKSNDPSLDIPSGIMIIGEKYYLRAEAHDINTSDRDDENDTENRSVSYMLFTPLHEEISDANHIIYVDKNATGAGDGSNWINAFRTIGEAERAASSAGDIIEISGGMSGKIYYEEIYHENGNGTSVDYIIYRGSDNAGHNGEVIMDGEGIKGSAFVILREFIKIENLTIRNYTGNCVLFEGNKTGGIVNTAEIYGCGQDGIQFDGHTNGIVEYSYVHDNIGIKSNGIRFKKISSGGISRSNIVSGNGRSGIAILNDSDNCRVFDNTIYNNSLDGIEMQYISGAEIYRNNLYSNGLSGAHNIGVYRSGTGIEIRHNLAYDTQNGSCIKVLDTSEVVVRGNIIYDVGNNHIGIQYKEATDGRIYNNTIIDAQIGIAILSNSTGADIRNNISAFNAQLALRVDKDSIAGTLSDYNNFYAESGALIYWNVIYNLSQFADHKLKSGQDTNSIITPPLFSDRYSGDFTLNAGSSAIDAGADLDSLYQKALHPDSDWPDYVITVDQEEFGNAWEMGAYIY